MHTHSLKWHAEMASLNSMHSLTEYMWMHSLNQMFALMRIIEINFDAFHFSMLYDIVLILSSSPSHHIPHLNEPIYQQYKQFQLNFLFRITLLCVHKHAISANKEILDLPTKWRMRIIVCALHIPYLRLSVRCNVLDIYKKKYIFSYSFKLDNFLLFFVWPEFVRMWWECASCTAITYTF